MLRLIVRKLALMVIILALLNYAAFRYAQLHPRLNAPFGLPAASDDGAEAQGMAYRDYLSRLLRGDLGEASHTDVGELIREPIRNSLILLGSALLATVVLGLTFGFLSISPHTRRMRPLALTFLAAGSSMPGFVFGAMVLSFLVYQLLYSAAREPLLPISGFGIDRHLLLPVVVLAIQPTFHVAKVTAGLLENELQKDYILVARSKGLDWPRLFGRHAWPNMLSPALITIGSAMRLMVGELVIVEAVFLWPGIGRLLLFALGLRLDARSPGGLFGDPELIAILAVIIGSWLLIADLIAGVLAYLLDPRLSRAVEESKASAA